MHKINRKVSGFTFIELIVTLFIGSLLLAWGVPNYRDFKVRKQVVDATNELVYSINFARAEAIRYGRTVRLRAKGDERNWQTGALTIDLGSDPDRVLADLPAFQGNLAVTQSGDFVGDLDFNSLGALIGGNSTQLRVEHPDVSNAFRTIVVLPSGTVRLLNP